jgi:hypothetical protein
MRCQRCQTDVASRAGFCHLCGTKQKRGLLSFLPSAAVPSHGCIKCGAETPVQSVFCSQCGWFVKDTGYVEAGLTYVAEDPKSRLFLRPDLPRTIGDVTGYVEYFVHVMREVGAEAGTEPALGAIERFFEMDLTAEQLQAVARVSADQIYLAVAGFSIIDEATRTYYDVVVRALMDGLRGRGVRVCYVLDNALADDRFQAVVEIYGRCGFLVHHPYIGHRPAAEHLVVERFRDYLQRKAAHLVYIEKDTAVNYLDRIRELARQADPPLAGVFRCDAPAWGSATYEL